MNYDLIETEGLSEYLQFLPEYVQQIVGQNNACVIGGFDQENTLICIGVFSYEMADRKEAELLYLYTREQWRGQGWAAGLLEYGEEMLQYAGIRSFICSLTGEIEYVSEMSEFLRAHSYEPQIVNWHMYVYSCKQVASSPRLLSFKNNTYYFQCDKDTVRRILAQDTEIPLEIYQMIKRDTDVDKSLFYVNKNQLMMAILVGTEQSQYHFVKGIYLNPHMVQKEIAMSMFAQMAESMQVKDMEQGRICFYINKKQYGQFCKSLFGEPQKDYWIQRYCLFKEGSKNGRKI